MRSINPGASWTLTFVEQTDAETLTFAVGEDCPYYSTGYNQSRLHINASKGIEIEGPGGELFVKLRKGTSKTP